MYVNHWIDKQFLQKLHLGDITGVELLEGETPRPNIGTVSGLEFTTCWKEEGGGLSGAAGSVGRKTTIPFGWFDKSWICGKCSFQIPCILFYEFMHLSTCSAKETEESYMSSVSWPLGGRMDKWTLHWVTFPPGDCCHWCHDLYPKSLKMMMNYSTWQFPYNFTAKAFKGKEP